MPAEFSDFLGSLDAEAAARLSGLKTSDIAKGAVLFRPGDDASGFLMVISGRVGVYLTGASGREILLYSVSPGETCVQTTLGLLGGQPYGGEGIAETALKAVAVPRALFLSLMASSEPFRSFVFRAFAGRLNDVMHVLEQVAFVKVEQRLARVLLQRADADGKVAATHHELAVAIGSVREVVSRRLEAFGAGGLVETVRGQIRLADRIALAALAASET